MVLSADHVNRLLATLLRVLGPDGHVYREVVEILRPKMLAPEDESSTEGATPSDSGEPRFPTEEYPGLETRVEAQTAAAKVNAKRLNSVLLSALDPQWGELREAAARSDVFAMMVNRNVILRLCDFALDTGLALSEMRDAASKNDEKLRTIAAFAHDGGLLGMGDADALVAVRKLTLDAWDSSGAEDARAARIRALAASEGEDGVVATVTVDAKPGFQCIVQQAPAVSLEIGTKLYIRPAAQVASTRDPDLCDHGAHPADGGCAQCAGKDATPKNDEGRIAEAVNRFLCWRLPDDFAPDSGISYTPITRQPGWLHDLHPTGTNLFNAAQAKAMFEHCLATQPAPKHDEGRAELALADEWERRCNTPECNPYYRMGQQVCADELRSLYNGRPFGAASALATQPAARRVTGEDVEKSLAAYWSIFEAHGASTGADGAAMRAALESFAHPAEGASRTDRNFPGDAEQENGDYENRCVSCGEMFTGYKRRVVCRACATKRGDTP